MAQIPRDTSTAMNNVYVANNLDTLVFRWDFATSSGEEQEKAEVRWRKMVTGGLPANSSDTNVKNFMRMGDELYVNATLPVSRLEDTTTWTIVNGQRTPPASGRKYSNIQQVAFPINKFTPGLYVFQVRMMPVGGTQWSAWTSHKIEITDYSDRQFYQSSATEQVKQPDFPVEGRYGMVVEVVTSAGVAASSLEHFFNVLDTNKYVYDGTYWNATPELAHNGTQPVRVRRA